MTDNGKIRLVYILSASHSGSTLLSMLLGAHPEICTVGELDATFLDNTEHYLCSCGQEIKKCRFWTNISQDMAKRGFTFEITNAGTDIRTGASQFVRRLLAPLHRRPLLEMIRDIALTLSPTWRRQLPIIHAINTNLMRCILARTGEKVIIDSSKIGIRLKYLLRNPSLDVKIIKLIRDGRGVALTYMDPAEYADANDPHLRGGGTGGNREMERLSMAKAALEWRRSNEEATAILQHIDRSRWTEVRYESLCIDTVNVLNNLFTFIGVDTQNTIPDFRSVEHHVVGNGMRLDSTSEIQLDERWRTMLTVSDLGIFESVAGSLNKKLGYN